MPTPSSFEPCCTPDPNLTPQQAFAIQAFKYLLLSAGKSRHDWVALPGGRAKLEVLTNSGAEGSYIIDVEIAEKNGTGKQPN